MKQAIEAFHLLEESVHTNCKDQSLLSALQTRLSSLAGDQIDPQVYCRLLFSIYDLSNHHSLLTQANSRVVVHNMSVRLKLVAMRMICTLMSMIMKGANQLTRLDQEIELEALEIMILSIRVCLDSELNCIQECIENQAFCAQLYSFYCPTASGLGKSGLISQEMTLLYFVNKFDVMRLEGSEPSVHASDLEGSLVQFYNVLGRCKEVEIETRAKYQEYISNVVAEITLKLLRQGKGECLEKLGNYLPKEVTETLKKLQDGELPSNRQAHIGEVYELYWQVATNGMSSVSMDSLQKFISTEKVLEGEQIFEAILLSNQPLLLEIWFNQANKRVARPRNLAMAYECFISLIVTYLNKPSIPSYCPQPQELQSELVRLCKQVLLNLFRQNKDTQLPVHMALSYVSKLLVALVTRLHPYQVCRDMFENVELVSSKHGITQISKTITALHLYYDLLHHQHNEDTFKKFNKFNSADKSEPVKLLKTCFQLQRGNAQMDESTAALLKKKPEFALLFCDAKDKARLLLNIDNTSLVAMENVFEVYTSLFQDNSWGDENFLLQIATHLQNFLQGNQFSKLSITQQSTLRLKNCLSKYIDRQNTVFSLLYLYLCCLGSDFHKVVNQLYGVVFNRYSKLLKILDAVSPSSEIASILQVIICQTCQKFKTQLSSAAKCSPEAGEIMFIKLIYEKLQNFIHEPKTMSQLQLNKSSQHFVKFSLFEIYCLNGRGEEIEEMIDEEQEVTLQHLYAGSQYVPRKYKLSLLRKLFRLNMATGASVVSLADMRQLMLLSENSQETMLYVTATVQMFGEKGKKFINLLADQHAKIAQALISA